MTRNLDLATKLACDTDGAEIELDARVSALQNFPDSGQAQPFDFCEFAESGMIMGACETLTQRRKDVARDAQISELTARFTPDQRAAFRTLAAAASNFAQVRAYEEQDLSSGDSEAWLSGARGHAKQQFIERLQMRIQAPPPPASADELAEIDSELNRVYELALARNFENTTLNAKGLRRSEKAWIQYREAWVALGATLHPSVSADAWRSELTRTRIYQLENLDEINLIEEK